jgi:DNA-binding NtrC family response regulator
MSLSPSPNADASTFSCESLSLRPRQPRRALILSTDKEFRATIRDALCRAHFVNAVNDGIEAVDAILSHNFNVILCDARSRALLGEAFYKTAIRMRPELSDRFIFITGSAPCARIRMFLAEAEAVLTMKSFSEDDFDDLVAFVELKFLGE